MDEFDLIDTMVAILGDAAAGPGVVVGPGDDAAVLETPPGQQLVVSTDTLVAGRHFPANASADVIGYRSMAVATSDLAAMGATPAFATVSLTRERLTTAWARRYATGMAAAAQHFGLAIVGGNVARGPCSVTVTVHGHVPAGGAILRNGAAAGDDVYVTGVLGGANSALRNAALERCSLADLTADDALRHYWMPTPRIDIGIALRDLASAAIDISDGLSSDLAHLCRASGVACRAELTRVPVFNDVDARIAAAAGDDYELIFTTEPARAAEVRALAQRTGVPITPIGSLCDGPSGTVDWSHDGVPTDLPPGYRHF